MLHLRGENDTMFQFFHWYAPADGSLWAQLGETAGDLARAGVTIVWIPPMFKGSGGPNDVGYGLTL